MSKLNYLDWIFAKSLWNKDKTQLPATTVEMQNQEIHRQSLPLFCSRNTKVNKKNQDTNIIFPFENKAVNASLWLQWQSCIFCLICKIWHKEYDAEK